MNLKKQINSLLFFWCCNLILVAQVTSFQEISSVCGIQDVTSFTALYGNGAAAADFDNDGDIDFYLTTDKNISDRLYRNDGQGNFIDIAEELGIIETNSSRAALWFDYNGDHRLDLIVAGENCVNLICENPIYIALYKQLENGTFIKVPNDESGILIGSEFDNLPVYAIGGLAAADIDGDYFLELIISVWGGGVKLFKNKGGATFTDITNDAGLIMEKPTPWQPIFHDFNEDGRMDIYCNVDFAPNKLWINKGDSFEDQAAKFGLDNAFNEMGIAMSDYDNDGDLDIYITNITRFFQGKPQYNLLLEQQKIEGQIKFREITGGQGVAKGGWDWGTTFIDIDNDGRQDLITTNGMEPPQWQPDRSKLWLNTTAGFVDMSVQCNFIDFYNAATLLAFDFDRDGDMDILQTLKKNNGINKPALVHENKLENYSANNYLVIKPRMEGPNHFGIGSVVTIVAEDLISSRLISAGCSFYGQEPAEAFFGLADRDTVYEVVIKWPTNEISFYQNIKLNQTATLPYDYIRYPRNLLSRRGEGIIELSWEDFSHNEKGFILFISEDSTFDNYEKIIIEENFTFYTYENNVEVDKEYYFKMRAFNDLVLSDYSNIAKTEKFILEPTPVINTNIYPNPIVKKNIYIESNEPYKGLVQIQVFDMAGKVVWSEEILKTNEKIMYQRPVDLASGTYTILVKMGNFEKVEKIVVIN